MKEAYINTIKEVIHRDGWKHVIKKTAEDETEDKIFNIEVQYHEYDEKFHKWEKKGETQIISSMILPEFIEALEAFT